MHARLFTQRNVIGFVGGFMVGIISGQGDSYVVQRDAYNNQHNPDLAQRGDTSLIIRIGAPIFVLCLISAGYNDLINADAKATAIGFVLGFLVGHATMPTLPFEEANKIIRQRSLNS